MKSSQSKKTIDEEKSKNNIQKVNGKEEEKYSSNEIDKEKTIERYIYITTYNDSDFLEKIKLLFEEINQKAFNLASPKEIYTHNLTEEERQNNEIDYISGFQILDTEKRVTIIEGITGKALQKIKESFPKTQMNSESKMIFSDVNILFNERIYSKFDLSLKFIKTRETLEHILTTFDIYLKSNNYRSIYDTFMKIGSILKAETLREITQENLFPNAEGILMLERKYGDILREEDLTGIKKEKIIKKKYFISTKYFTPTHYGKTQSKIIFNSSEDNKINKNIIKASNPIFKKLMKNALTINTNKNNKDNNDISMNKYDKKTVQTEPKSYNERMLNIAPKIMANNKIYNSILKTRAKNYLKNILNTDEIFKRNIEDLKKIKRKGKFEKFWKPDNNEYDKNKKIYFYAIRANHYDEVVSRMREKYLKDKSHFYTYSDYSLALSFPMIDRYKNEEYLKYLENKSKWINKNDFERYKQPEREKIYFPRINKEI